LRENENSPEIKARGDWRKRNKPGSGRTKERKKKGGCMEEKAEEEKGRPV